MSILTDDEIKAIADITQSAEPGRDGYVLPFSFTRAIESAVIAKLAAGVSVEPVDFSDVPEHAHVWGHTAEQLQTAIAAARVQALEEAAKVCAATVWSVDIDTWRDMTKHQVSVRSMMACASAIRDLIGKEST